MKNIPLFLFSAVFLFSAITSALAQKKKRVDPLAIPEITRRDEVGDIVTAVKVFQKNAIERREMRAKEAELQRAQAQRSELMEKLTKNFENTTGDLLADVGMALEKLRNSASTLGRTAETSKARASDAASVVSEVAHNAESVASAA